MHNIIEYIPQFTGLLISVILIIFEIRKTRKLEVYYKTFETLLIVISEIEETLNSLTTNILNLKGFSDQLPPGGNGNYIIERPLGEDINVLEQYIDNYDYIKNELYKVQDNVRKISFLSKSFKNNSKSRTLLVNLINDINTFVSTNYEELLKYLKLVKIDRYIPENSFPEIFSTINYTIDQRDIKVLNIEPLLFKIENLDQIMNHFNKNNFL